MGYDTEYDPAKDPPEDQWGTGLELRHALALDNAKMLILLLDRPGPLGEREWLQVVQLSQACAQFARHEHLEAIRRRMPGIFEIPFRGGEA